MKEWIRHKAVRISAMVLLALIALVTIAIVIAQIYISSHKSELLQNINQQLSKTLKGDVHIQDLEVNAWAHFPQINVSLQKVTITDSQYHRPLANIQEVSTRIPVLSVLRKNVLVRYVRLYKGKVHLFTDSSGYTNTYLLSVKPGTSSAKTEKKQIIIREIELEEVDAIAENLQKHKRFEVYFKKLDARIRKKDSLVLLDVRENVVVKGLGFNLEKGSYLADKPLSGRWKMTYNVAQKTLSFPQTDVKIDGHPFMLKGEFVFGDSSSARFALDINTRKIAYQKAASLLTQHIQQKLGIVGLDRPLHLTARLEGSLGPRQTPHVQVRAEIKDNILVTPLARFESCDFLAYFTNEVVAGLPRNDENSRIMLTSFSAAWGGALFKGQQVVLDNLKQPRLAFDVNSQCALSALDNKIGLQTLRFLQGTAEVNLRYNGPIGINADITRYLSGNLFINDGTVHYEPRDLTFSQCKGQLEFSPDEIHTTGMECSVGRNHFRVKLEGNNLSTLYEDAGIQKASLYCEVGTGYLNLADFRSLFNSGKRRKAPTRNIRKLAQAASRFDDLLEKGEFRLKIAADTIELNHFSATQLTGEVVFNSNDWQIRNVSVQHGGGSLQLRGNLQQLANNTHKASTDITLTNVDVRKTFYAFDNFGQHGITSANLRGRLSAHANLRLMLNNRGDIVGNTMNGLVFFSLKDGELVKFEPLENIKNFIFRDKDLSHVQFAELKDSLIIKDSEIKIKRMEIHSSIMTLYVEGLYSLRGNTDISIQIPLHNFVSAQEKNPRNKGANAKMGASIHLRARPDLKGNIKIGLDLFKKYRKAHKNDPP
ncbi:hypothetical protein HNQ91_005635 [Filimonas zeae]|uniref:AsmA domain-containing protein n=1 Tax=Filimonas zeae TaxID=1737353 RepID=A0A917MZ56_9BACT|nr:AsmA-like C-terminal region-containing protein [Filimonas zeae]MDR6342551.1 hypothetical protein [Filimonas zeae]GGH81770.1 hypothetical protein GCM10011379_54660 [Filimonas zeae]